MTSRKFNHFGIVSQTPRSNESHNEALHLYCTDVADSPNKIEFLRFEANCPFPELVKTTSHIAYEVPSMEEALKGAKVIYPPFEPVKGMQVAFIEEEGIPIELDCFF